MTNIDEILICANQLANAGKKPTVALVKAKMSQTVPLAMLITTLKNWQHQPDFVLLNNDNQQQTNLNGQQSELTSETATIVNTVIESVTASLLESSALKQVLQQSLRQELTELKDELAEMKLLIKVLTEQLDRKI